MFYQLSPTVSFKKAHATGLASLPHALPNGREVVAAQRRILDQHHGEVELDVEVEDVQRGLDGHLHGSLVMSPFFTSPNH